MSSRSPIEDMINGLKAYLAANFNAALANANTSRDTAAPDISLFRLSSIGNQKNYPEMIVNSQSEKIVQTGNGSHRTELSADVGIGFNNVNDEVLDIYANRYKDALIDCIGNDMTLGGVVDLAEVESTDKYVMPGGGTGIVLVQVRLEKETID